VIFFKDYLREEMNPTSASSSDSAFVNSDSDKIVDFPACDSSQECSREEIGKWVDKLMALPDDVGDLHRPSESADDPFLTVASKILREELN
tara:strand:- start:147 stop:419 length:273 start_codon:yes stop_codon:yes gene_type:complete